MYCGLRMLGRPARLPAVKYAAGEKEAAVATRGRTIQWFAFDSHRHDTWALVQDETGNVLREQRINPARGALQAFLEEFEPESPVAVESIENRHWIIDEIEAAGMVGCSARAEQLGSCSATAGRRRLKDTTTDKLYVRKLNRLQRSGALPTVWIPPRELRDARELPPLVGRPCPSQRRSVVARRSCASSDNRGHERGIRQALYRIVADKIAMRIPFANQQRDLSFIPHPD
jgi:hypothetical protein